MLKENVQLVASVLTVISLNSDVAAFNDTETTLNDKINLLYIKIALVDENDTIVDKNITFYKQITRQLLSDHASNESIVFVSPNVPRLRQDDITCHFSDTNLKGRHGVESLSSDPPDEKSILFLKLPCNTKANNVSLNTRQACAVESAARHNPKYQVHVLLFGPSENHNSTLHDTLMTTHNVKFHQLDLLSYVNDTPVMDLVKNKLRQSKHALSHLSDVLRLLTLWKFGGIYMDLDVVVVQSLQDLPPCFVGAQSLSAIGSSIMALDRSEFGKKIADLLLRELVESSNSPGSEMSSASKVITRVVRQLCPQNDSWFPAYCEELRVLEPQYLYPVPRSRRRWYVKEQGFLGQGSRYVSKLLEDPRVHVHHVWDQMLRDDQVHSGSFYVSLAAANCPAVHGST